MEPLTAADRCDRCGARARARTAHESGPLLWCEHHFREHEPALTPFLVAYTSETTNPMMEMSR